MPPRPRTRLPAARRRAQLLDAATALVAAHGYRGVALQDVADACGITVAGLLYHFPSKDELLVAVLEHRDATDARALARRLDLPEGDDPFTAPPPAGTTLAGYCQALVDINADHREVVRLYTVLETESLDPQHPAHDYFERRQRRALASFAALARDVPDPAGLARHVLALMDGLQVQWLRDPDVDLRAAWATAAAGVPGLGASTGSSSGSPATSSCSRTSDGSGSRPSRRSGSPPTGPR